MAGHAASLEFEEAQDCKDRLDALEKIRRKEHSGKLQDVKHRCFQRFYGC